MRLLGSIMEEKQMKKTLKYAVRGFLVTGTMSAIGAFLGGPPGFLLGSTLGGFFMYATSEEFQSVPQILMGLPPAKKEKLYNEFMAIVGDLDWKDLEKLTALVTDSVALKDQLIDMVMGFLRRDHEAKGSSKAAQGLFRDTQVCIRRRHHEAAKSRAREKEKTAPVPAADGPKVSGSPDEARMLLKTRRQWHLPLPVTGRGNPGLEAVDASDQEDVAHVVVGAAHQAAGGYL